MRLLDPGAPLFVTDVLQGGFLPNSIATPNFAPTWLSGTLFDVSAYDAWSLFGQVQFAGTTGPGYISLRYYDQFLDDPQDDAGNLPAQSFFMPTPAQNANGFLIVGRTLGPVLAVQWNNGDSRYHLRMYAHNRTRRYDTPYTPAPLGSILAVVPLQTMAAGQIVNVPIPFYMGPARMSFSTPVAAASPARCRVVDITNGVYIANINTNEPNTDLWLPGITSTATPTYSLQVINDAAAPANIGATLIAA